MEEKDLNKPWKGKDAPKNKMLWKRKEKVCLEIQLSPLGTQHTIQASWRDPYDREAATQKAKSSITARSGKGETLHFCYKPKDEDAQGYWNVEISVDSINRRSFSFFLH